LFVLLIIKKKKKKKKRMSREYRDSIAIDSNY